MNRGMDMVDVNQTVRMNPGEGEMSYARNSKFQVCSFSGPSRMKIFLFLQKQKELFPLLNVV